MFSGHSGVESSFKECHMEPTLHLATKLFLRLVQVAKYNNLQRQDMSFPEPCTHRYTWTRFRHDMEPGKLRLLFSEFLPNLKDQQFLITAYIRMNRNVL
jgi:hypothetical protein